MKEVSSAVAKLVKKHGGKNFAFSSTDAEAEALWEGRKTALWSAMALIPDAKCWSVKLRHHISLS
jgi:D-lactate dehydrogenase (cytochrome)